jgi:hypothetical protein
VSVADREHAAIVTRRRRITATLKLDNLFPLTQSEEGVACSSCANRNLLARRKKNRATKPAGRISSAKMGTMTITKRTKKRTIPEATSTLSETASRTLRPKPDVLTTIGVGD